MATRQYTNPWAQGISTIGQGLMAREQGLAELAAAQREKEIEAQRWAQEYELDQTRTLSNVARDQSTIGLNEQELKFNEQHNPLLMDKTRAQTFSANASGQSSLASAENTRLDSDYQRLANFAASNNMERTGGRSTEVFSPGQSQVANAEEMAQLAQLSQTLMARLEQVPDGSPEAQEIEQNLNALEGRLQRSQQVYDDVAPMSTGSVAARRAQAALRKQDQGQPLTEREQRDIEVYESSQPRTDAAVGEMTSSQRGRSVADLGNTFNAAQNLTDTGRAALDTIQLQGDKIFGIPASLTRMADGFRGTVTGLSDLTGLIDPESEQYVANLTAGLTENAGDAKNLQSLLTDFAIMNYRLKNPSDPRMSDFDLKTQLSPLQGGSARSIAAFLEQSLERVPQYYDNAVRTRQAMGVEVPEGLRSLPGSGQAQPQQSPGPRLSPEDEALLNKYLN